MNDLFYNIFNQNQVVCEAPNLLVDQTRIQLGKAIQIRLKKEITKESMRKFVEEKLEAGDAIHKVIKDLAGAGFSCNKPCRCGQPPESIGNNGAGGQGPEGRGGTDARKCVDGCRCSRCKNEQICQKG